MADQHRSIETERVQHRDHIISETIRGITGHRRAGITETATSHAVHVILTGQFRCELIENVRGVAEPGQKHNGLAGTAPIKHLEFYVAINRYEARVVRRRIT